MINKVILGLATLSTVSTVYLVSQTVEQRNKIDSYRNQVERIEEDSVEKAERVKELEKQVVELRESNIEIRNEHYKKVRSEFKEKLEKQSQSAFSRGYDKGIEYSARITSERIVSLCAKSSKTTREYRNCIQGAESMFRN